MNKKVLSERDICTKFITPALVAAGWDVQVHIREEMSFTKARIIACANSAPQYHEWDQIRACPGDASSPAPTARRNTGLTPQSVRLRSRFNACANGALHTSLGQRPRKIDTRSMKG